MTACRYTVSLDSLITGADAGYGLGVGISFNKAGEPVGNALQYEDHPPGSGENRGCSGEPYVLYPQYRNGNVREEQRSPHGPSSCGGGDHP
jgi:hypothetical protein